MLFDDRGRATPIALLTLRREPGALWFIVTCTATSSRSRPPWR